MTLADRETDMRALVVDDSRTVRIIIGNILRELGIEVVEAGTAWKPWSKSGGIRK